MVKFEDILIPSADLGNENPMPDIKNVSYIHAGYEMTEKIKEDEKTHIGKGMIPTMLPYRQQDGYNRDKKLRSFHAAIVENSHIRAVFLPELGGRLFSLYDKDKEEELLYVNPVFQPGNLGLRNAWFSGGVEFNVGIKGHNPLTCSPLHARVDKTEDGEVLHLYEYERIRGVVYSISAYVKEDSPVLYINCRIENTEPTTKWMYWWSNIAVPETKGTRVIVPTDDSFLCSYNADHYVLDKASIPNHGGIDVTYPLNIPSSKDFFYKIPEKNHKWIVSVNEQGTGLLQCSTQFMKGRKLFVWGNGTGGRHWNEWLSEEGSAYIEIQAGLAHTQLEHIPMEGNSVWEWTEAYTIFQGDPKIMHGDYNTAIATVEEYMMNQVGNPDELVFPKDSSVVSSKTYPTGSSWGAIEETLRGERISNKFEFPNMNEPELAQWQELLDKGTFPTPSPDEEPGTYVNDAKFLQKLESLKEQSWFSLLHIGVIRYALAVKSDENYDSAKEAWEASIAKTPNAWAYRNLAMLYKNEYGNTEKALEYILSAYECKSDCTILLQELSAMLTSFGKDEKWLEIYETLSDVHKNRGRLLFYKALAFMNIGKIEEAAKIIQPDFVLPDIKEGELSISYLWFELYRRIYAKENGIDYKTMTAEQKAASDKKYPLPKSLDFRMHD